MICGGGMRDDNTLVYGRFVQLAGEGATIGVVPTATGVDPPGAATLELLQRHALPSQRVVLLPLTRLDEENAQRFDVAEQVRACRGLWFVGGDQSRITAVFRPRTTKGVVTSDPRSGVTDSPAYRATLDVLRRGGVIGGTSAGAAMMSDPMLTGGTTENALRYGAAWTNDVQDGQGVGLAPGMGYFPYGLIDQHFLERGRLGRLLVAMHGAGVRRAWGVRENGCLEVDLGTGKMRALGPYSVVAIDLGRHRPPDPSLIPNVELMRSEYWERAQLGD
jgi:cyanophycinase